MTLDWCISLLLDQKATMNGMKHINAELPHVFLKHKNEKTCMENKARETWKKGPTAARKGREACRGVETVVAGCERAYKPNGTLMVNGGLR